MSATPPLDWPRDGATHHPAAAAELLPALHQLAANLPQERAGLRLHGHPALPLLLPTGPIHNIAARHLGPAAQPVRAVLFDKTPATNCSLGWHQDRTIAVRARADVPGYGPWSTKQGIQHVEPPFAITEAMVTLRIHLDDTPIDNAPLLIAPGSHRLGRIAEDAIAGTVARCGAVACLANAGDVWCYATPILHASAAAQGDGHRRVLQVDYAATALPAPLVWLGL
ncbi:MAG: phytanoyl-CoA dioxygenase family protein [Sphingomonas phyllosphaerae]|uniref:phytanoyl-CoA dioxygenase family protein n=1 Tax=Sphingomonas phyllosphaerae TaxID=257003 RepID=UPI002FF60B14